MGVSASGKSTVGRALAKQLNMPFIEGDDFHPEANIAKMKAGTPLTDADRLPWLQALNTALKNKGRNTGAVMACSALRSSYRQIIRQGLECQFIYLKGSFEIIHKRATARNHFMPASLLQSQFDTLEEPQNAWTFKVSESVESIITTIKEKITVKNEFGLIGLGVMGKSISRNIASKDIRLSVYNRHVEGKEENIAVDFTSQYDLDDVSAFDDLSSFVDSLEQPRRIFLMITAGEAIDQCIEELIPLLAPGDIIMDGANAHYSATKRRTKKAQTHGIHFFGIGVSGGEEGALKGPAIMVGGPKESYPFIQKYLERISAIGYKAIPCCQWMGPEGAGHFVKMVHNGIEYAEMQFLAEMIHFLRYAQQMEPEAIATLLESWLETDLSSYLLEISIDILRTKEGETYILDTILDQAGNKGTGSWTTIAACELGIPIPTISAALFARYSSAFKKDRISHAAEYNIDSVEQSVDVSVLQKAYRAARILNHDQGIRLIQAASVKYGWHIPLHAVAQVWSNGCIIRSNLMNELVDYLGTHQSLLEVSKIRSQLVQDVHALKEWVMLATNSQLAIPCFSASWHYFLATVQQQSSANIIQAQRDYFGAHTYKHINDPDGDSLHTNWQNHRT